MISCLVDLAKFIPDGQNDIDIDVAKKYFVEQVLPYASVDSLQRLIMANEAGDLEAIRSEMMRMFVESELTKVDGKVEEKTSVN